MAERYVFKQESCYGCPGIESVDKRTIVKGVAMKEEGDMIHFYDPRVMGIRQRGIRNGTVCGYSAKNRPYPDIFPEDEFVEIAELERKVLDEMEREKKQEEMGRTAESIEQEKREVA